MILYLFPFFEKEGAGGDLNFFLHQTAWFTPHFAVFGDQFIGFRRPPSTCFVFINTTTFRFIVQNWLNKFPTGVNCIGTGE